MQIVRIASVVLIFSCLLNDALAGGIYLREYGQPGQGTSGAGNTVLAEDASVAFLNPAGVFNLESKSEWMVTGIVLDSSAKFKQDSRNTIVGSNGGDAGDTLFGAAVFHSRQLNDKWGFTFSLNSLAGSALSYNDDFVGRYTGKETELLTITALPSLAYKINDELAVSFGIGLFYGELELEQAIPKLLPPPGPDGQVEIKDGNDTDFTPMVSALWQPNEEFQVGFNYIGETKLDFEGDLDLSLPIGVNRNNIASDVEIVLPQRIEFGTSYEINDKWTLLNSVFWEDWSALDSVPISTNNAGIEIPLNWDDVWGISSGFRYKHNNQWTWYGGIAYDSDPASKEDQIAILPADRQIRYSTGVNYQINDKHKVGGTLTYIDLGNARIENDLGDNVGTFSGDYSTLRLIVLGLNYNWR